jgi:cell pole-organizing protein PopZ
MANVNKEPSMEEILSSIKRIISEDKAIDMRPATTSEPPKSFRKAEDNVLELTVRDTAPSRDTKGDTGRETVRETGEESERLIDESKLQAMRASLSNLATAKKPVQESETVPAGGTSLEDLTRDLLRPMLKQWLDDNLPAMVEELVAREVARIAKGD